MWVSEQQEQVCVSIVCLDPTIEATLLFFLYSRIFFLFLFLQNLRICYFIPNQTFGRKVVGRLCAGGGESTQDL